MTFGNWFLLALICWALGYAVTKFVTLGGNFQVSDRPLIQPPRWLFWVCGGPSAKELPFGVMVLGGLQIQGLGLLMLVYAVMLDKRWPLTDPNLSVLVGLFGCMLAVLFIGPILRRFWGYKP
jgi:hypothetical protein